MVQVITQFSVFVHLILFLFVVRLVADDWGIVSKDGVFL